jgi:DNA polymerase-3 subunit alpha/error-prone DNA polymerase
MEFLTFEDETGVLETTFFPQVYRKYARLLMPDVPYLLQGVVEVECGAVTLTVRTVRRL